MLTTDIKVAAIVSRVALLVALTVMLALPLGYWIVAYTDFSGALQFKAKVKATALSGLIATSPDTWMFAENRLEGLLTREPVPIETEAVAVYDEQGQLLVEVGTPPLPPVSSRSSRSGHRGCNRRLQGGCRGCTHPHWNGNHDRHQLGGGTHH